MVEFSSQSRALLMWQELFISSGATVYLTVPLLYPIPSELLGQLLPVPEHFLHALSFWVNQAKPALEDFASSGVPMKEPVTQNSKGTVFLVNHIRRASTPSHSPGVSSLCAHNSLNSALQRRPGFSFTQGTCAEPGKKG